MELLIQFVLVLLLSFLDRVRGNPDWQALSFITRGKYIDGNALFEKAIMGYCASAILGHWLDWATILIVLGMIAGSSPGWGGAYYLASKQPGAEFIADGWQISPFDKNGFAAVLARGAIWGVAFTPVAFFDPKAAAVLFVAYLVAFPASFYAVYLPHKRFTDKEWADMEWARGWIAGTIILVCYVV